MRADNRLFLWGTLATVLLSVLVVGVLFRFYPELQQHFYFTLACFGLYLGLLLLTGLLVTLARRFRSPQALTQIGLLVTVARFLLSAALVATYYALVRPPDRLFILPFFTTYLIFTLFESYYLVQLSDSDSAAT